MKKLFIVLFLFSFAAALQAQWNVNGFETAAADSLFRHSPSQGLQTGDGALIFTDITDNKYHGNGALKIDWLVHSTETWGGYTQLIYDVPQEDSTFLDWSSAKSLRLWYYVESPSSVPGGVELRMQIYESGGGADYWGSASDHESWYFNAGTSVYDAAPGWNSLIIPLTDHGEKAPAIGEGFSLPGWAGTRNNGELELDKITGYIIEFETPGIADNGKAQGTIIFDKLEFYETTHPAITNFDNTAADYFNIDDMSWAGEGNAGSLILTDITENPFEGTSSLQYDYKVNASQDWGGYVNIEHAMPEGEYLQDMSANSALFFYCKVTKATTGTLNRNTFRFFLYDGSTGTREPWQMTVPIDLYSISENKDNDGWQLIKIPLVSKGVGAGELATDGFVIPSWENANQGDGVLNLDKIVAWKVEISAQGTEAGPKGEISEGTFLLDIMSPAGFHETDITPPVPPEGILAINSSNVNIVTWNDVPSEDQETYNIYYSDKQINSLSDPGLEVVALNIAEGVQLYEHLLRAPVTDQSVTYYYAINAKDKAGNVGEPGTSGAVTNTAKGVTTISLVPPTNFTADGDLSEWAGITPISMSVTDGSAFLAANSAVSSDADLSLKAYLAIDNTYLYVAFDVEDDVVVFREDIASYLNDAPDLFIGLFDWHGAPHGAYKRGAEPDYHLRFTKTRLLNEGGTGESDSLVVPGENYFWGEKFPTGYSVEARIPLQDLATKRNAGNTNFDDLFVPVEGMRIPLDFSINDNDTPAGETNREGIMCYSPYNNDQSWSTTSRWLYTWIGNKWTVGVNDDDQGAALTYKLAQNYPNPFNPSTSIKYSIQEAGLVTVKIFDILGREVANLVNEHQNAGSHTVNFNASNLTSGIYLYEINSGSFRDIKKMMLLK